MSFIDPTGETVEGALGLVNQYAEVIAFASYQKEIKAILERAAIVAKRLPGKLQKKLLKKIHDIAEQAGVELAV